MKNTMRRTGLALALIAIFSGASFIAVSAQFNIPTSSPIQTIIFEDIDMLIFVSPQYAYDTNITTAIDSYISTVNNDTRWNTKIITLTEENNDYQKIDQILENHYNLYNIKAAIMIGEDTDTALSGDSDYMEKPSIVPWYTTGGKETYEVSEQGIISKPYKMDICISLLYPTSTLDYQTKKTQIVTAFNKFSTQRQQKYDEDILVFESTDLNKHSKEIYQSLDKYGNLLYNEDPTESMIKESLENSYSMYYVHGHSNPAGTELNGWFSAENVDTINTQLFAADGCYVSGWWSKQLDNDVLDPNIDGVWYGSKIFSSEYVQVMVLGLLSQNGFSYSVSFIENAVPGLIDGETLAESMIGHTYVGDNVLVYGDPTFHFTF